MTGTIVVGVGMVHFGRHPDRSAVDLASEASLAAVCDAGIELKDVDAFFCGHVRQGMTFAQRVVDALGIAGIPATNFENACASSATALHFACLAIAAGRYRRVLVCGCEKMERGLLPLNDLMQNDLEALIGMTVPSLSALMASWYGAHYELKPEDLAAVAVKNRAHAAANPHAHMQTRVSTQEVLKSPMISTPLTKLMCCPTSDGAAAIVVTPVAEAPAGRQPIRILASHLEGGYPIGVNAMPNATARAALRAYEQARIRPADVSLVEALDYTAMAEILLYEDLGFCARGEGVRMLREGETACGGRVCFSPGGGLIGRGHPLGATGIAQVVEAVVQLRHEAGERQVPAARVALTHAAGGVITGIDDEAVVGLHLLGV